MGIETIMWLFVIVFVIHEFEEIVMLKPWLKRNRAELQARFPRVAAVILRRFDGISTSAVAFAILEQLLILVLVVLIAVHFGLYPLWAGVVTGYLIHIFGHLGQFAAYRRYCPFIYTSVISVPFSLWALAELYARKLITPAEHIVWSLIALALIFANLRLAHRIAARFEGWLKREFDWAETG